jgi:lipid-A-disaccharide synthase
MLSRLFFSVGEPSGDLHAANLIRALTANAPKLHCRGFGGLQMVQAGFECDFDLTQMAVVGISEVLPKLREFYRLADQATDIFRSGAVDAVVLVDFPGFNWHIAKRAKQFGLPVFYYCPPQLWAWGGWRVKKMRKYVDRVLCNLPFERDWFAKNNVPADFVGHPFFDDVAHRTLDSRFIQKVRRYDHLQVAVLPGSRDHEVDNIWPIQLEVIRRLNRKYPDVQFLVAAYKDAHALRCREHLKPSDRSLPLDFFVGKTSELIQLADCSLMKSGSVSLEMMARSTPAVVVYHLSRISYAIMRSLAQCDSMTLPNLIAGKTIMPEFLAVGKSEKTIGQVTAAMDRMLGDDKFRADCRHQLQMMADEIGQPGASRRAAETILAQLSQIPAPKSVTNVRTAA